MQSPPSHLFTSLTTQLQKMAAPPGDQSFSPTPLPAQALLAWSLCTTTARTILVVTESPHALEALHQDAHAIAKAFDALRPPDTPPPPILFFPALETLPGDSSDDMDIAGARQDTLLRLYEAQTTAKPALLITCVQALLSPTPTPEEFRDQTPRLSVGETFPPDRLAELLVANAYTPVPEVQARGQFVRKGGLLDVWPVNELWPVRLEFFGETVESMRTFDPLTQRSVAKPATVRIAPVRPLPSQPNAGILAGLPDNTLVIWTQYESAQEHASAFEQRYPASRIPFPSLIPFVCLEASLSALPTLRQWRFETAPDTPAAAPDFTALALPSAAPAEPLHPDAMQQQRQRRLVFLEAELARGHDVLIFFDTAGTQHHFAAEFKQSHPSLRTIEGALSEGFRSESLKLTVLSEADIYGQRKIRSRPYDPLGQASRPSRDQGERIADLAALHIGDLVIHTEHGLGRYCGLSDLQFDGQRQEVITIEYDEGAKLHVPVAHAHLLSRYVSVARQRPKLHRLGGGRWNKEKAEAEKSIADMAASLLETQAQRDLLEGFQFPPDAPWQREFESSFPYTETADQIRAIADTKHDMESPRPMDRLICGDAGYGKTEVALRAAFKTVTAGRQVAVLVPTTVLAQQHYQTFCERMAPYPFRIEVLSRFSHGRHAAIQRGLADGTVDIVIGTHALIQPAVHFKNLGLAVIDEEQRFGVGHKERLKHIRRLVDVLTLTATPIPRTLYMSMTGSRDMSLLQTPPRERMAIETVVARNTDDVVREAIVRELNRDGQVYYLHNRVMTIERVRQRLARLVPEARVDVGHGQMSAGELKSVMRRFVTGESDVLLCTTIIESGMDIPRANTILIDRADRFGIADLYQLRGRVGRSRHKAYAILLMPPQGAVDADARQRISALQRHSALGAGFNLALRDLEIRGAGNLLGAQQSGHIATIGFGLYCQLLQRTVARLKGQPLPPVIEVDLMLDFLDLSPASAATGHSACIPYEYIADEAQRMDTYRRLAKITEPDELTALRAELVDRYGPPPQAVVLLLRLAELRLHAHAHHIQSVRTREDKLILTRAGNVLQEKSQFPRLRKPDPMARLSEILSRIKTCDRWSAR